VIKRIVFAAVLAGVSAGVLAPNVSAQKNRFYWYHPSGSACPTYGFNPDTPGSEEAARKACVTKHGSCGRVSGTSAMAC